MCLDNNIAVDICMDLQRSHVPYYMYYMKQLSVNVVNIHNLSLYTIIFKHTMKEPKGERVEICSFLMHFLDNVIVRNVKYLLAYLDDTVGQNKHITLVRFL